MNSCSKRCQPGLTELAARLRGKSHRLTGPRAAILRLLREQAHPLSNKEILASLSDYHCDLATVYRSMHLLEKMGIVKRFDFGDGIAQLELISEGDDGHHHHLVCTRCSNVVEIEECLLTDIEDQIARRNGFKGV